MGGRAWRDSVVRINELQGIDVSHYQSRIKWDDLLANHELHFVFVKATEGGNYVDSLFAYNWSELCRLDMRRGAYHFFRPRVSGKAQASHFLSVTQLEPGDFAPVLDIETTDGAPVEELIAQARIWLQTVERELGVKPIIYTNMNFYDRYLAGVFDHYPLWVARYSDTHPHLRNGRIWQFWQHSDRGRLTGIAHPVDLNRFSGEAADLEAFLIPANSKSDRPLTRP